MPPYVGMARKQNGGYNASISVQTPLVRLVANCTHPKTVRSALLRCPNTTVGVWKSRKRKTETEGRNGKRKNT